MPVTTLLHLREGLFCFFVSLEDRDLIFQSGPYLIGVRGLYLNHWSLDFTPTREITSTPFWVCLPHHPLVFRDRSTLKSIGDSLGKFNEVIDIRDKGVPIFLCPHLRGSCSAQRSPSGYFTPYDSKDLPPTSGLSKFVFQMQHVA